MSILNSISSARMADPAMQAYTPPSNPQVRVGAQAGESPPVKQVASPPAAGKAEDRNRELEAELAAANSRLAGDGHEVRFEYDRSASALIVRLVDIATSKVLRQYPSEEALRTARLVNSGKSIVNLQA